MTVSVRGTKARVILYHSCWTSTRRTECGWSVGVDNTGCCEVSLKSLHSVFIIPCSSSSTGLGARCLNRSAVTVPSCNVTWRGGGFGPTTERTTTSMSSYTSRIDDAVVWYALSAGASCAPSTAISRCCHRNVKYIINMYNTSLLATARDINGLVIDF